MRICTTECRKWVVFAIAVALIVIGTIIVLVWDAGLNSIVNHELSVQSTSTTGFVFWRETPIPLYMRFKFFNWTNYQQVIDSKWKVKPHFQECGPYTFMEKHIRVNVEFYDNGTLSYQQKRVFNWLPEESDGSLDDVIYNLNPIPATMAYIVRNKARVLQSAVDFLLREKEPKVVTGHKVRELLFEGYDDPLLTLARKLNISGLDIPFSKFGWFVERNDSASYDGNFTMFTGETDTHKLGIIERWNGLANTGKYASYCGMVNGTSGELWPTDQVGWKTASVFTSDLCSTLNFARNGTSEFRGIEGSYFVGGPATLDDGTVDKNNECFESGERLPTGVRNVSLCKWGAPAFISFPHFYAADPAYLEHLEGLSPQRDLHEFQITMEPTTGLPLKVTGRMQLNLLIQPMEAIKVFRDVPKMLVPMLWFEESAALSDSYASMVKVLLTLPKVGLFTGYGVIVIGLTMLMMWVYICVYKAWKVRQSQNLLPTTPS